MFAEERREKKEERRKRRREERREKRAQNRADVWSFCKFTFTGRNRLYFRKQEIEMLHKLAGSGSAEAKRLVFARREKREERREKREERREKTEEDERQRKRRREEQEQSTVPQTNLYIHTSIYKNSRSSGSAGAC